MGERKKPASPKKTAGPAAHRKAIRELIPKELQRQIDELVELGWFPSREHIVERALQKFVNSNRPELLEKAIRDDVEWALRGRE